ncbi:hypothetical protein ATPR_2018 [Acetobacter tropicalis NBRC 101654]|uniref:Uncharacterized protein n=1 Tax=Acetobacter tropicalis NBRC 101654 TaxID=749388 RepID=F7VF69_9PROT|nr:hypothetical protein ATPR_2018 [Acetobacter tropicalis NBRC 101654]
MQVGFRLIWRVHVDDGADIRHIQPTGGNVRCHQNRGAASRKAGDSGRALCLRKITMQRGSPYTEFLERAGQLIGFGFGFDKDQSAAFAVAVEKRLEERQTLSGLYEIGPLPDWPPFFCRGVNLDFHRFAQKFLQDGGQGFGQGGGNQHGLAYLWQSLYHGSTFFKKLGGEQAVSLIQHYMRAGGQINLAGVGKIQQAAGGGNQHTGAIMQQVFRLRGTVHPAIQGNNSGCSGFLAVVSGVQPQTDAEHARRLQRQFSRGYQHQRILRPPCLEQLLQHGQRIGCGFTRAGRGYGQNIAPGECRRNGLLLNGGRSGHACLRGVCAQGRQKAHCLEAVGHAEFIRLDPVEKHALHGVVQVWLLCKQAGTGPDSA